MLPVDTATVWWGGTGTRTRNNAGGIIPARPTDYDSGTGTLPGSAPR